MTLAAGHAPSGVTRRSRRVVVLPLVVVGVATLVGACGSTAKPDGRRPAPSPTASVPVRPGYSEQVVLHGYAGGPSLLPLSATRIVAVKPTACTIEYRTVHPIGPEHRITFLAGRPTTVREPKAFGTVSVTLLGTVATGQVSCTFQVVEPPT